MQTTSNTLTARGIILQSGEISKDKIFTAAFLHSHDKEKRDAAFLCPLLRSRGIKSLAPCGFTGAVLAGQGVYT